MTAFARGADEALAAGLVDEVAPKGGVGGGVEAAARKALRSLGRVDRDAIALLRRWSAEAPTLPLEEAVRRGADLSAAQLSDARVTRKLEAYFLDGTPPWGGAA